MSETVQSSSGNQSWALSGLSLGLVVLAALWTYIAWLSNSNLLDFHRLQLFLTHHTDITSSLVFFASGVAGILLMHEAGHIFVANDEFRGAPVWLPAPGLYIPSLGGIQTANAPVSMRHPGRYAIMGPLFGSFASASCLILGSMVLENTPYVLALAQGEQSLLAQFLTRLGLNLELNGLQVAGWMGLLLSSLQLLPIGATDGGQVLREVVPKFHLTISIVTLTLLVVLAFSLPIDEGFTWWAWAAFCALHLFGNPVISEPSADTVTKRLGLGIVWALLLSSTLTLSLSAIPSPVIPEADISKEVEL